MHRVAQPGGVHRLQVLPLGLCPRLRRDRDRGHGADGRRTRAGSLADPGAYADPVEGFKTLYFDTVLFDPEALIFLKNLVGAEKIMLGSDYPFPIGDPYPLKIIQNAGLSETETNLILGDTAAKKFKVKF